MSRYITDIFDYLNGSVKEPNILIYFFFPPITQSCPISDILFTDGREVSDFSVLQYYLLNSVNILNDYLRILIDCSQLSKTYYNVFGSFIRDRHARRIYLQTFAADENHS